jgi:uncharacterized surface protein with fasciclin (FAS1) repeats
LKRLFLKAAGVAAAGALLKACGGGGGGGGGGTPTGTLTLLQIVQQDSRFSSLLSAVERAGLTGQLAQAASQTLFAPTNEAFSALESRVGALSDGQLASILSFHLAPQFLSAATLQSLGRRSETAATLYTFGGDAAVLIFVGNGGLPNIWDGVGRTSITFGQTDVAASNGVLHVVNDVLLPRHVLTVAQMLRASIDSFSDFSASVLGSTFNTLNGAGPFTVFVPINDAVNAQLTDNVVRRHIVSGQTIGSDTFPPAGVALTTLNGQVTLRKGTNAVVLATLTYGPVQANVTDVDFFASNGVIHVIDHVLA